VADARDCLARVDMPQLGARDGSAGRTNAAETGWQEIRLTVHGGAHRRRRKEHEERPNE
jgi:hypothetical protein